MLTFPSPRGPCLSRFSCSCATSSSLELRRRVWRHMVPVVLLDYKSCSDRCVLNYKSSFEARISRPSPVDRALLPRLRYFEHGTCIVHHIFGGEVCEMVAESYGDAYITAHFEVGCHDSGQVTGCHRSQITGYRSQITHRRSQVTGHRSQVTDHRLQITGYRPPSTGNRSQVQVTELGSQVTCHGSWFTGHGSQVISHRS